VAHEDSGLLDIHEVPEEQRREMLDQLMGGLIPGGFIGSIAKRGLGSAAERFIKQFRRKKLLEKQLTEATGKGVQEGRLSEASLRNTQSQLEQTAAELQEARAAFKRTKNPPSGEGVRKVTDVDISPAGQFVHKYEQLQTSQADIGEIQKLLDFWKSQHAKDVVAQESIKVLEQQLKELGGESDDLYKALLTAREAFRRSKGKP
jgi:hypothetical protein